MEHSDYYVSQLNETELIALFGLILKDCAMRIIRVHKKDRVGFIVGQAFQVVYVSPFTDAARTTWFTLDDYYGWNEHEHSEEYQSNHEYTLFLAKRFGKSYITSLIEKRLGLSSQFLYEIYNPFQSEKKRKSKINDIFMRSKQ